MKHGSWHGRATAYNEDGTVENRIYVRGECITNLRLSDDQDAWFGGGKWFTR